MRNDTQKQTSDRSTVARYSRSGSNLIPYSFKALSRIVSSGASSIASTVRTATSTALRDPEINHDQVSWAGFDKLELELGMKRQVLLLGFNHGFQVWDVEEANNVCNLASSHDPTVSFMQMQPIPQIHDESEDKFVHSRPLLIICGSGFDSEDDNNELVDGIHMPTTVLFYSLKSRSYVHILRFRSVVHLVRCSSRIVAVLQSAQIHCLNSTTLVREYTIVTNPLTPGCYGLGPLAVGSRWIAYSGSLVMATNPNRVSPQHIIPSSNFPAPTLNGSIVAKYAKDTSKQLAAGIVTFGDMGYKKLSRYYSDLLPNCNDSLPLDTDNAGMVIVRDIVQKTVIAQFRAHKSPISALCFDPSGILLVTASVHGHNINVFRIMARQSGDSSLSCCSHIYRLQRGFTNAVINDISFSSDSHWIMISSSRGTSHLFDISPSSGIISFQSPANPSPLNASNICEPGSPISLSPVTRIRNGNNSWRNTVNSAAIGRVTSLSGAIASVFYKCKGNDLRSDTDPSKKKYHILVFSPSGCLIQYALHYSSASDSIARESSLDYDPRLMVDPIQKWNICQKRNRKDLGNDMDTYGENWISSSNKVYPEKMKYEKNMLFDSFRSSDNEQTTTAEKHSMYISEAELQMHQNTNSLWFKSEQVHFQMLLIDGFDEETHSLGEFEIEKLPVHTLELSSKELIPVYNPPNSLKFQNRRVSVRNSKNSEKFQPTRLDLAETSYGIRSSSPESRFDSGMDEDGLETNGGSVNTLEECK